MKGHNLVILSGNVSGHIVAGTTNDNEHAFSFSVSAEDGGRFGALVRVNVYGGLALKCKDRVSKGLYVSIIGELMNRRGKFGELTEVRAKDVLFFQNGPDKRDRNDGKEA